MGRRGRRKGIQKPKKQMRGYAVRIGSVFPAEDPVARFNVVMGMISNDWARSSFLLERYGEQDNGGVALMMTRQQLILAHEAASFIADSRKRFPEIDAFITGLGPTAQEILDRINARADPRSSQYLGWLEPTRNLSAAHFPELHPERFRAGKEELANALSKAADQLSPMQWDDNDPHDSMRFYFSDDVLVHMLPPVDVELPELIQAAWDVQEFARLSLDAHISPMLGLTPDA
jgi:hypothetical protein